MKTNDEINQELLNTLRMQGFSDEIIMEAIKKSKSQDIESIIEYIESMQKAETERKRREFTKSKSEAAERIEQMQIQEEMKEKRLQKIKDMEYLEKLRAQTKADRQETEERDEYINKNIGDVIKSNEVEIPSSPCKIKVRFEEGLIKILGFEENSNVTELYNKIREVYNHKSIRVYVINPPGDIVDDGRSLKDWDLFPNSTVMVKKL